MIVNPKQLSFLEYLVYFPGEDEPEYDGVHDGGIKGFREGTSEAIIKQYSEHRQQAKERGVAGWETLPALGEMKMGL